jgi:hypothetical protein
MLGAFYGEDVLGGLYPDRMDRGIKWYQVRFVRVAAWGLGVCWSRLGVWALEWWVVAVCVCVSVCLSVCV